MLPPKIFRCAAKVPQRTIAMKWFAKRDWIAAGEKRTPVTASLGASCKVTGRVMHHCSLRGNVLKFNRHCSVSRASVVVMRNSVRSAPTGSAICTLKGHCLR